jgi:hydroxymethylglutaryl-CoA reductase (NADPH)
MFSSFSSSKQFMKLSEFNSPAERRAWLEKKLGIKLEKIAVAFVDEEKDIRCENLIGETTLPLGVAGPVTVNKKEYFIPLATTEGALVASVNRGCKAMRLAGGVESFSEMKGVTRGPVFFTGDLEKSFTLKKFIEDNFKQIQKIAASTSSHLQLIRFETQIVGPYFYLRLFYDTDLAMGMNMVTIASEAVANFIEEKTKVRCLAVAGNFDIDKKPAYLNFFSGRGISVWAQAIIPDEILKEVLKTNKEKMFDVWLGKNVIGSAISGSLGYNSHFANIVAAFFAATGQDLAHVVEGSLGLTVAKVTNQGLYFSVYLPSVVLGLIGGGMRLSSKKEGLAIVGAKTKQELAEVLATAVMAGELSLLAAIAEDSLACAHKRLGR